MDLTDQNQEFMLQEKRKIGKICSYSAIKAALIRLKLKNEGYLSSL
jgi:hypothetical protein